MREFSVACPGFATYANTIARAREGVQIKRANVYPAGGEGGRQAALKRQNKGVEKGAIN